MGYTMHYLAYIYRVIIILAGIRSVLTQQATLTIQLWGNPSNDSRHRSNQGYSTSEHSGFMAILIGIGEIATGVLMIAKGPAYFG